MKTKGGALTWLLLMAFCFLLVLYVYPKIQLGGTGSEAENVTINSTCNSTCQVPQIQQAERIRIATWNLQIFGRTKAADDALMTQYADTIGKYDLIAVQEIRDSTGEAFEELCGLLEGYSCFIGLREGRTSRKEQYGLIWKSDIISLMDTQEDNSSLAYEKWERPPMIASFKTSNWTFDLLITHIDPDEAPTEIKNLEGVAYLIISDAIVLGDLNADCSYYDTPPEDFTVWNWVVPDEADTTAGATDCAYDRIIVNDAAKDNFVEYGIDTSTNSDVSDHYLVWAEFEVK
jgi:endonuclease/exonuclease/phosphatase family metal-dependent hydrolase